MIRNDLEIIDKVETWTKRITHLDIIPAKGYSQQVNIELDFNTLNNIFNNLTSLKCSSINVTSVRGISINVSNLTFINVDFTNIKYDYFKGLITLQKLGITGNTINYIKNKTFSDLNSLLTLDLMSNNIQYIASSAFYGLIKLNTLKLNNNKLIGLDAGTFTIHNKTGIYELIDISGNALTSIKSGLFISHYIKRIDLSDNKISNIESNAFNTSRLEVLKLQNNLLSNIDERVFGNLNTHLTIFTIYNNNIRCDCEIFKWLGENHPLLPYLNSSSNKFIKCYKIDMHLFEFKKRNNCTQNKGIYITFI